jgi:predicted enzyme related to lactoylglutathione lyase
MAARIRQIVFDAQDIESVAEFWAALLAVRPTFRSDDWITLSGEVNVSVQRNREHRPCDRSDPLRPQQIHLDIEVDDIGISEEIVVAHGGTKLAEHPEAQPPFRVYADPAGHPFCLEYKPLI